MLNPFSLSLSLQIPASVFPDLAFELVTILVHRQVSSHVQTWTFVFFCKAIDWLVHMLVSSLEKICSGSQLESTSNDSTGVPCCSCNVPGNLSDGYSWSSIKKDFGLGNNCPAAFLDLLKRCLTNLWSQKHQKKQNYSGHSCDSCIWSQMKCHEMS